MTEAITRILLAADGYLELGMLDHAAEELEGVAPEARLREDVLAVRCKIFMRAEKWDAMRDVAKHLVAMNPGNVQHWIWAAYATWRADNIHAAREMLQRAKSFHPGEPMIDYPSIRCRRHHHIRPDFDGLCTQAIAQPGQLK